MINKLIIFICSIVLLSCIKNDICELPDGEDNNDSTKVELRINTVPQGIPSLSGLDRK